MAKLKRSELRAQLLSSVQILKRSLDYSSWCYLILAILFFNHAVESPARYGSAFPGRHIAPPPPIVPGTKSQRKKTRRDEDEWEDAFAALEDYLPLLKEVLTPAIKGVSLPDNALAQIQAQIDQLQRSTGVFSNPDSFGFAFEYWIDQLAGLTVKRGVSFYTQRPVIRLMVELLKPHEGMAIYDPSAGTGGTLIEAARYVEQHGGSTQKMQFYGREKAPDIWAIGKMNLLAQGLTGAVIERKDTLQAASNLPDSFDLVLQDLPLSPNRRSGQLADAAFLRHALQALGPDGKAAVLCPSAIAQHDHPEFWHYVFSRDWLEAVIGLPPGLLHGTPSGACLFVFNKQKAQERLAHVLFVQAAPDFVIRSRRNQLADDAIKRVMQVYDQWESASKDARIVPLQQIEEQNYRLNVDRYLEWVEPAQPFNASLALSRYRTAVQKRDEAVTRLMQALEQLNDTAGGSSSGNSAV